MGSRGSSRTRVIAPFELPASVAALLGEEAPELLRALEGPSPVSVRLNPSKAIDLPGEQVPWCAEGRYLSERPLFTLDPLLHAGCYYVQEASSMLVEQAFAATGLAGTDLIALDLCAAPGGKSTHLAALITRSSLLVCNEPVRERQAALMENVWKHGGANTAITGSLPAEFVPLGELFDLVLVDAPCSGEGMFRKDRFARTQWNERLVASCARTQEGIIDAAWNALRPGGALIYSTCTWEPAENEEHVRSLVDRGGTWVPLSIDPSWGIVSTEFGHRCYPHKVRGEGLFISVIRKPGTFVPRVPEQATDGSDPDATVRSWLNDPDRSIIVEHAEVLHAVPRSWWPEMRSMIDGLRVIAPGVPIAERKGAGWRPHPALALNTLLSGKAFDTLDVDRDGALAFLRGEALSGPVGMNVDEARGVRLVRHEGHALGWAQGAGTRWNNGWPKGWRIRMR